MFTRAAIENGRTVDGETLVVFKGHPLEQLGGSRVGGTGLALPVAEGT
jgi:hypothetical protein